MRINEDRVFGVILAVVLATAAIWILVALVTSADLDAGQSGFVRYALLIGLAAVLGFGAGHFLGGDRGFAVFLAALLVGAVAWIAVGLLTSADLSSGQATLVGFGLLLGLAAVAGAVAGHRLGEDRGFAVFLLALIAGAAMWIVVGLATSLELNATQRQNFGYVLFLGVPLAAGWVITLWMDAREERAGE